VLFADIEGWNDLAQSLPAQDSIRLLKELTSALDATVERFGVEKIQEVGTSYLALSGLSGLRSDHEQRSVDCGLAMLQDMRRFNQTHNLHLSLNIGLHAGPLTTGVVRGERLSFDIWGETINIARGIHESRKHNVIQASAPIVEALRGLYSFKPLPPIGVKGHGEVAIWEVAAPIQQPSSAEETERKGMSAR
jgi:class 3 adenylate cyclase